MHDTLRYVVQQILWLFGTAAQLVVSMGVGIKWVFMTVRCLTFAMLDLVYFLPHVVWYIFSPSVIRGVSYRSSRRTKVKNLEKLWKRETSPRGGTAVREAADAEDGHQALDGVPLSNQSSGAPPDLAATLAGRKLDLESVERLAATINPADGSMVDGLPVNLADDLSHIASSNSFDDALLALQRVYQRRAEPEPAPVSLDDTVMEASYRSGSFSESDEEEDEEDRQNLHNRAKLDIYLPVPLDSLFRFMDQEKKNEDARRHSDDGGDRNRRGGRRGGGPRLQRKKFPIVISVNGGAWIVGYSFWNFLVARVMALRGYVVFCPDYRNFPQTTMEGMTLDVSDAIAWVLNNAERYNGDLDDVTLVGQSAGAHLTMMSLLSQAHICAYEEARRGSADGNVSLPPPSPVAYNVPRYNPRKSIRTYVGLSGIYNVRGLVKHFDSRGLYRNVLNQIAGGRSQMPRYTIPAYFDNRHKHLTGEYLPDNIFEYMPQQMSFLHGDNDKSAPVTESANLCYILRNAQRDALVRAYHAEGSRDKPKVLPSVIEFILVPGANHTDSIIEEPLCCRNSHIVEFLTLYRRADEERKALLAERAGSGVKTPTASSEAGSGTNGFVHGRGSSLQLGASPTEFITGNGLTLSAYSGNGGGSKRAGSDDDEYDDDDAVHPVAPVRRPDGILLSPMPAKDRKRLLRLASYVCPF